MEQKKARKTVKCPICYKPSHAESFPFCSNRCRQVDLHRWFSGKYFIPGEEREIMRASDEIILSPEDKDDEDDEWEHNA